MPRETIDSARYPIVASYLGGLPDGIDSHPQCLAKASLYRCVLDACPLPDTDGLPDVLADLLVHPRPVNTFVPEVRSHALMLSVYDRAFGDDDRFARFCYETQHKLWSSKIYAVLMRWTSPQRLLSTASARWQLFHRGSTLNVETKREGTATLRLTHPPGLYDHISRIGLTEGLRAALAMSSGYRSTIEPIDASSTGAVWRASWTSR